MHPLNMRNEPREVEIQLQARSAGSFRKMVQAASAARFPVCHGIPRDIPCSDEVRVDIDTSLRVAVLLKPSAGARLLECAAPLSRHGQSSQRLMPESGLRRRNSWLVVGLVEKPGGVCHWSLRAVAGSPFQRRTRSLSRPNRSRIRPTVWLMISSTDPGWL
jgi:hypothetical protein